MVDENKILLQITDALLDVCDGAKEKDESGFNKPDSDVVRKSYPDVVTIAPLLMKYKKQIECAGFNYGDMKKAVIAVSGPLPTHNWSEYKVGFGKHASMTYAEMADTERGYLSWMDQTFEQTDSRWVDAHAVITNQPIPDKKPAEPKIEIIQLVLFKSGMVGVQAPYENRERCQALSQRRWEKPYWVCPASCIEELADAFPDGEQSETFQKRLAEVQNVSVKSEQIASDFNIEHFGNGKEMFPFQKAGLEFVEATGGNALIADQMGLGKTIQALSYIASHPEHRPIVIVCPASLKLNWQREAQAWLETDDKIEVVKGKPKQPTGDIVIINYDILNKWLATLKEFNPKILIYDESHSVKNQKSARSKAAMELAEVAPHKLLLTGTPVLNRPAELWNQLRIIDPFKYPDEQFFQWHKRYTNATQNRYGWDFSGASNLDELAQSLKSVMIRRTKDQVLTELPEKQRSSIFIPIDNKKEYQTAERSLQEWLADQEGLEPSKRVSSVEHLARIEYLRQIAVKGKLKQALAWIRTFLEGGEKLVVFATHKKIITALMDEFGECAVKIDGSVSTEKRQEAVDRFQTDDGVKLFVGNIKAAGVGITLTSASNVAFLELPWTPADLEQAEDRCHRIGQTNAVNIHYLLAQKTIDQTMAAMVEEKRGIISQITSDKNSLGFDLFEGENDE